MRKKKKREPKLILTDEVRFQPVLNKNNEIIEEEIEKNLAGKYLLTAKARVEFLELLKTPL